MSHYYSEKQVSKLRIFDLPVNILGNEFNLITASGVFSAKKLDKGTELLINKSIVKNSWKILDLGCGYGIVGISFAKAYPKSEVVMSDVNKRAIKISRMNIKKLGLSNIKVINSDRFEKIEGKFNTILLNPPQSAGKQLCFDMIEGSKEHLKKGGLFQLVARHNKGGKPLSLKMEEVFGNVNDIAKKSGFRVYVSEN